MTIKKQNGPKVLFLDLETKPLLANVWDIWEQNVALNQIKSDWSILSWSVKWQGEDKIYYLDQRKSKNLDDDKELMEKIWKFVDEADIIITHNGVRFDQPRLNTRFVKYKIQRPSSYKSIDTLKIAKKHFDFTSNKLEYLADFLGVKHKKLAHKKFPGQELWNQCMKGNLQAWNEMELYNKNDVVVLEDVYEALKSWDTTINFNVYHDELHNICSCGSKNFKRNGHTFSSIGKYQRYKCTKCGAESRDSKNLLTKEKKASLRR